MRTLQKRVLPTDPMYRYSGTSCPFLRKPLSVDNNLLQFAHLTRTVVFPHVASNWLLIGRPIDVSSVDVPVYLFVEIPFDLVGK